MARAHRAACRVLVITEVVYLYREVSEEWTRITVQTSINSFAISRVAHHCTSEHITVKRESYDQYKLHLEVDQSLLEQPELPWNYFILYTIYEVLLALTTLQCFASP